MLATGFLACRRAVEVVVGGTIGEAALPVAGVADDEAISIAEGAQEQWYGRTVWRGLQIVLSTLQKVLSIALQIVLSTRRGGGRRRHSECSS